MANNNNNTVLKDVAQGEVILKVENLCQFFRSGKYVNKAVNNVSFDIKKGEVFGLVGESGCGKTTTGRSIIKLYNITSGNVIFKGQRVAAGTLSYKEEIKAARKRIAEEIAQIKAGDDADKNARIAEKRAELAEIVAKNKAEIAALKAQVANQIAVVKAQIAALEAQIDRLVKYAFATVADSAMI